MNKTLVLLLTLGISATAHATYVSPTKHLERLMDEYRNEALRPITPTFLENAVESDPWRSNWFVDLQGGANFFLGSPLGCEDAFGRVKPLMRGHVGKWFTPSVGSRLSFEGFKIQAADMRPQGYRAYHMDLMWNPVAYWFRARDEPRWDVIPYIGVGMVRNTTVGEGCQKHNPNSFALSYGVMGRYRLTPRLHLTMELGNITTFKNFDGYGDSRELGDHVLGLSAGISLTLGKTGWKRVVDAKPYMARNEHLAAIALAERDLNRDLVRKHEHDQRAIAELKKILRIEGLLSRYSSQLKKLEADDLENSKYKSGFPKNDYSGLNSLMARLHGLLEDGDDDSGLSDILYDDWLDESVAGFGSDSVAACGDQAADLGSSTAIGNCALNGSSGIDTENDNIVSVPVYFFFRLGTAKLTDESQLINIDEIARIASEYSLKVRVTGAADSATGSVSVNAALAKERSEYIARQLRESGVEDSSLIVVGEGGIDTWPTNEANRHTRIEFVR